MMIVTTTTIMIMIIMVITVIVVMKITTIIIIIYVGTQLIQAIFNAPPPISYIAYYIYIYEPFFFIYLWSLSIRSSISLIYRSDWSRSQILRVTVIKKNCLAVEGLDTRLGSDYILRVSLFSKQHTTNRFYCFQQNNKHLIQSAACPIWSDSGVDLLLPKCFSFLFCFPWVDCWKTS